MNSDIITGFNRGEANRNAIAEAKGTPALSIPRSNGIVEQEQNGVRAPNPAPRMLPRILCCPPRTFFMVSSGHVFFDQPTRKVMPMNKTINSTAISTKKFTATAKSSQNIFISFKNFYCFFFSAPACLTISLTAPSASR